MKRIISILLIICSLTLCVVSCDNSNGNNAGSNNDKAPIQDQGNLNNNNNNDNNNNNSSNNNNSNDNNNNNNSSNNNNSNDNNNNNTPTCKETGLHTYEQGECTGCKLKVFDVLKEYIIENCTSHDETYYVLELEKEDADRYHGYLTYSVEDNYIEIRGHYDAYTSHDYYMNLVFTPYTFEDGGYEWSAGCWELSIYCNSVPKISGVLDPSKFSSSTNTVAHTSNASGADDVAKKATDALQGFIEYYLIDVMEDVGQNMSMGALGFKRYDR